jgi:hypothetical protein
MATSVVFERNGNSKLLVSGGIFYRVGGRQKLAKNGDVGRLNPPEEKKKRKKKPNSPFMIRWCEILFSLFGVRDNGLRPHLMLVSVDPTLCYAADREEKEKPSTQT